jgi:hypothetical protein
MAFSDGVVLLAWTRAGCRCECTRTTHGHTGRCPKPLVWNARNEDKMPGCWEAYHITAGGPDTLSNCEILCCDCHKQTQTYGG